jgi:branched-chain amino acid aminotransferase
MTAATAPFGSVFTKSLAMARFADGRFGDFSIEPVAPLTLHPGAHVLHYASTVFEGLKAHRQPDGGVAVFRVDRHVARMGHSAELLCLPAPPADLLTEMILALVAAARKDVPDPPGSLYLRPTLVGTEANVGAAASPPSEGFLYVLASPVGDYFSGGIRPLRVLVEEERSRSTAGFGMVKTGGNYAAALRTVVSARRDLGADQVLFAPLGVVTETGASNFLLLDGESVVTSPLDDTYLHGVTRDSVLQLADHLGYAVHERPLEVSDVLAWAQRPDGEAALSGTAAVLSGVGTLIHRGEDLTVGTGSVGSTTLRLRNHLADIQTGAAADPFGWLRRV